MRPANLPLRQRGVVMFTALILMVLMLLVAISSFNMGRQNTIIAGNMQNRAEAISSANQAIEQVLSNTAFIADPTAALPGNQAIYDVNGDGYTDVTVTLNPPPCAEKIQIIKNNELDVTDPNDAACIKSAPPGGAKGAASGDSLCASTVWEINAVATDVVTGAATTVTTGVGVRVPTDEVLDPAKICP